MKVGRGCTCKVDDEALEGAGVVFEMQLLDVSPPEEALRAKRKLPVHKWQPIN